MGETLTGTVRIGYVQVLLDYLKQHQYSPEQVFTPALLAQFKSASPNERLPIQVWGDAMERACALTKDEQLALKLAQLLTPKHWGVFAYAAMTCKTLADVVVLLERYERLIDDMNDSTIVLEGGQAKLQWLPKIQTPSPAFMQMSTASWVIFARRYTERNDLIADADFTFSQPGNCNEYERLFGGNVRFNQPVTQILFPLSYLQLPIAYHDPDSHRVLLSQIKSSIHQADKEQDLHTQLRDTIITNLHKERVTLEYIADQLKMPARALQYQLEQNGTTFRKLLDQIRLEMAQLLLEDADMTLVDIAFLLGYSEQSPFTKAFKRWTGETPGEYRKRNTS